MIDEEDNILNIVVSKSMYLQLINLKNMAAAIDGCLRNSHSIPSVKDKYGKIKSIMILADKPMKQDEHKAFWFFFL